MPAKKQLRGAGSKESRRSAHNKKSARNGKGAKKVAARTVVKKQVKKK